VKNSRLSGWTVSQGGFPRTASKPLSGPVKTSGKASSQWKNRCLAAMTWTVGLKRASRHVSGMGTSWGFRVWPWSSRPGQKKRAHQRSRAAWRAWRAGSWSSCCHRCWWRSTSWTGRSWMAPRATRALGRTSWGGSWSRARVQAAPLKSRFSSAFFAAHTLILCTCIIFTPCTA